MMIDQIHFEIQATIATITLNRPDKLNAISLAMLEKLDRLAEVRTAMHPGEESLDHVPGPQFQPGDAFDRLRMQKSFGIGHRGSVHLRARG